MALEQILEDCVKQWPDADALHDGLGSLTYQELYGSVMQLKAELEAQGITAGQGVTLLAQNGRRFLIGAYALMACGVTVVPLNWEMRNPEILTGLSKTKVHALLDDYCKEADGRQEGTRVHGGDSKYRLRFIRKDTHIRFIPDMDAAWVRYRSSTSTSIGVVLTQQDILDRVAAIRQILDVREGDTVSWCLPMSDHFVNAILACMRNGAAIAVCKDLTAQKILEVIYRLNGNVFMGAPIHIRLLAVDRTGVVPTTLRRVYCTSAPLPAKSIDAFNRRYNKPVAQMYSQIETGIPIINDQADQRKSWNTIGRASQGYEVAILDAFLSPAPSGRAGKLAIKGPGLFSAYFDPWASRVDVLKREWFMTGDVCELIDNELVELVTCENVVINVSGNKVFPEDVVTVLKGHAAIHDARVFGVEHPVMGEVVSAEVALVRGQVMDERDVIEHCKKLLSVYKVPQKVEIVDSLVTT